MSVYIENEYEKDIPERFYEVAEEIVDASLSFLKCPYEVEVNIIFTGDEGIREINNEFRSIDSPTDVLSFPLIDYVSPGNFDTIEDRLVEYVNQDTEELMFGDIILNVDRIHSQAEEFGHSVIRELAFLVAHSMLHLAGYDHIDDDMRRDMEESQNTILNMKGYTRDYEEK